MFRAFCFIALLFTTLGCQYDSDCILNSRICVHGKCHPRISYPHSYCFDEKQCTNFNKNLTCHNGKCLCRDNLHGWVHISQQCEYGGCTMHEDCGPGFTCHKFKCQVIPFSRPMEKCHHDYQCYRFDINAVCDTETTRCVCKYPFDTFEGKRCNLTTIGCESDSECPYDQPTCYRGRCGLEAPCTNTTVYVDDIDLLDAHGIALIVLSALVCILLYLQCSNDRSSVHQCRRAIWGYITRPCIPRPFESELATAGPANENIYEEVPMTSRHHTPPVIRRPATSRRLISASVTAMAGSLGEPESEEVPIPPNPLVRQSSEPLQRALKETFPLPRAYSVDLSVPRDLCNFIDAPESNIKE